MEKLKQLIIKHWDILSYLFFGVLTTLVNYAVFLPLHYSLGLSATVSNSIAWAVSVAFAFLTNKPFVFRSHDWSADVLLPELWKFTSCRIASGILETLAMGLTVDILGWNAAVMKIIVSVVVVIINYIASKLFVFKDNA